MKKTQIKSAVLIGMGVAIAACTVTTLVREIGQLSEEVDRGYAPVNDMPVVGQARFTDTSGVRIAGTVTARRPMLRGTAAIV